jgi:hypothetical protein
MKISLQLTFLADGIVVLARKWNSSTSGFVEGMTMLVCDQVS